mgnify:CR=1 FL=1
MAPCSHRLAVLVEAPQHSGLLGPLDYRCDQPCEPGALVRVPLGRRTVTGVVWGPGTDAGLRDEQLKSVTEVLPDLPPLPEGWRQLVKFAASYYQRSLGEMAMMVLPPELRQLDATQWARRVKRLAKAQAQANATAESAAVPKLTDLTDLTHWPQPTPEQHEVLAALSEPEAAASVALLWGSTGLSLIHI